MSTAKWLGIIVLLAIALALIRAVFGDSLAGNVAFAVAVFFTLELVRGQHRWLGALLGALLAAGLFTVLMKLQPPNTAARLLGTVLIVSSPVLGPLIEQRIRGNTPRRDDSRA